MMQAKVPEDSRTRLADVAVRWRDAQETAVLHRHRLHDAVINAIDVEGMPPADVARIIGVSPTRIYAIVIAAYRDQ